MKQTMDATVSNNFHTAKFLAILVVMLQHYFKHVELLWVVQTIGLLVFSWSSGFFSFLKYHGKFDLKKFWKEKVVRLAVNLFVVNAFLLILFLVQGKNGIWTWQTIVNMFGMNGFLNWFRIPNSSPFGAGMWFFTLLLMFYFLYPLLVIINRNKTISYAFVMAYIVAAFYLDRHVQYGHMLWLTSCGFIIGMFCSRHDIHLSKYLSIGLFILTAGLAFSVNYLFKNNGLNFFFILLLSMFTIFFVQTIHFPAVIINMAVFFSACLLEIYLIHPYLFIRSNDYINFIVSLMMILSTAKVLQLISLGIKIHVLKI